MIRPFPFIAFLAVALLVSGTPVTLFAQSSYTGSTEGFVGTKAKKPPALEEMDEQAFNDEMERTRPQLPPVFENVQAPTAINEDGTAAATAEDPCAAYLGNFDGYTLCQDRIQKIQKMKDGRKTRKGAYGTQQKIRASEQRRIDAEKAAVEAAAAEEKAKEEATKAADENAAEDNAAAEEEKEKTPAEKARERKEERLKPKKIGG